MRCVIVAVFACLVTSPAIAQGPAADIPAIQKGGTAPAIVVVEGVKGDKITLREYQYKTVQRTRTVPVTEKVMIDGKVQEKTKYVDQTYTSSVTVPVPKEYALADVLAFDLNGNPVPKERLAAIFPKPGLALLAFPGMPVDPAFLKVARDGTILIALRRFPQAQVIPSAPKPAGT